VKAPAVERRRVKASEELIFITLFERGMRNAELTAKARRREEQDATKRDKECGMDNNRS
jgi:hypothetical protein